MSTTDSPVMSSVNRFRRRDVVMALTASLLFCGLPGWAQQVTKMPRVAWISAGGAPADEARYEQRMEARFRELGWTFGRNLEYVIRRYRGDSAALQRIAAEVLAMKCDVVMAGDNYVVSTLKLAGVTMPIVAQVGANLPELGLIASYARPGGNITGLAPEQSARVVEKYPEIWKDMMPGLTSVGLLFDPTFPSGDVYLKVMERAASQLGITYVVEAVRAPGDIGLAIEKMVRRGVQALQVWPSGVTYIAMQQIHDLAVRHQLPDMTSFHMATKMGALVSYGADFEDMYVRSVDYVDKILRGAKAGELPVEQARKYDLIINLKRARSLGLTIPNAVLARADEVIQ
jgi:putative tryptophan/tyrosine transport system substrate-binding protein